MTKDTRFKRGRIDRRESFDEFLEKNGLLAETEDAAIKEIIADQIKVAMDKKGLNKSAMAARMKTSPAAIGSPARSGERFGDTGDAAKGGERGGEEFEGGVGVKRRAQ